MANREIRGPATSVALRHQKELYLANRGIRGPVTSVVFRLWVSGWGIFGDPGNKRPGDFCRFTSSEIVIFGELGDKRPGYFCRFSACGEWGGYTDDRIRRNQHQTKRPKPTPNANQG